MKIGMVMMGGVDRSGTHRVTPAWLALIGGVAARHDVHVFTLDQEPRPGRWRLAGATIHNIGARPRRLRAIAAILAEHRRGRFDVLHAFSASPPGVVAAVAGRLLRRPMLLHLPGGDLAAFPEIGYGGRLTRRGRLWVRAALAGAARVAVLGRLQVEAARALGIDAVRLPFGVALDRWPPLAPRPRQPGRPARLLHIGSLNRVKDQPTLLRAAASLARQGADFTLDIVGTDTLGGAVQRLARDLGLGHLVAFHGFLTQAQLRPLVERADLLVISSISEAQHYALHEAAVAGVPAVGTNVGHVAEWAPEAALAVPVGDAEGLARAARSLLDDDGRRLELAAAAQARALAEDAACAARKVVEVYERLTRRPTAPSTGP